MACTLASIATAQTDVEAIMRDAVSYDITARILTGRKEFSEGLIVTGRMQHLSMSQDCIPSDLNFYEMGVGITHVGISYTMAVRGGEMLRLGGFTEPQVLAFTQWLDVANASSETLACISRSIAYLLTAAGNDSVIVIGPDSATPGGLPKSWEGRPETRWVMGQSRIAPRTRAVAVKTLGLNYPTEAWEATHFVFLYDNEGRLTAWSSRTGKFWRVK